MIYSVHFTIYNVQCTNRARAPILYSYAVTLGYSLSQLKEYRIKDNICTLYTVHCYRGVILVCLKYYLKLKLTNC